MTLGKSFEIKFEKLVQFEVGFVTPEGDLDLHNFADFEKFEYWTARGEFRLHWVPYQRGKFCLGKRTINNAILVFKEVALLEISPRDSEMPNEEDRTLESYNVLDIQENRYHLLFEFLGGMKISVVASRLFLLVNP